MQNAPDIGAKPSLAPKPAFGAQPAVFGAAARRHMVFAAALSTIFMAAIEGTIVATAMPTIVGALGGLDLFSWLFGAYLLTQAIMIPIYGRLADLHGRKPILLSGIAIFLAGSALCGFSWNMASLIVFRIVQGIGAGALIPISQTVVGDIYSGEQRARMQGYVSSTFGSAAILGPMVGGLIATHVSWKAIFWVNIPLGLVAASLLIVALQETSRKREHRIDYAGAVLMAVAIAIFMFALVHADTLETGTLTAALIACFGLMVILAFYERRIPEPMLPFKLYRNRIIAGGNFVGAANGAIMMSIVGFLPVYMQGVMGAGTVLAGSALGAMSVAWPFGGFVGSRLVLQTSYRAAAMIGATVLVIGSIMLITLHAGGSALQPIAGAALMGLGMGVTNICFVIAIQADVDWTQRGAATSSVSFSRIIGQALGSALFGGILNAGLAKQSAGHGAELLSTLRYGGHQNGEIAKLQSVLEALAGSLHSIYMLSGLLALLVLTAVMSVPSGMQLIEEP
jgi:EmrB/QacA subfamily drug resistance transporter